MKISAFVMTSLLVTGIVGPAFAFGQPAKAPFSTLRGATGGLILNVDCDPNGDGKQANCMRDCDEEEIRSRETYHSRTDADRLAEKGACAKKCGC
ncbi:MAG: hypothetical protein WB816_18640 [Methylocystis sp.]